MSAFCCRPPRRSRSISCLAEMVRPRSHLSREYELSRAHHVSWLDVGRQAHQVAPAGAGLVGGADYRTVPVLYTPQTQMGQVARIDLALVEDAFRVQVGNLGDP